MRIEAIRRNMPQSMGSLYWQFNDLWPVFSWSSVDYYGQWKALHYTAKRLYDNVVISVKL
jgi:beta-mannosidase